ncbi:MAG TPA: haloacid dehalogenase type II [Acidobacteriota bacterium]|nr:haloacid dehalogenase type II [Acidobacteriota bacterium]
MLSAIKALTFDCYGTLIDWERGIGDVLHPWAARHCITVSDEDLLAAFAEAEPACEAESPSAPYPDILRAVHRRLAHRFDVSPSRGDADALAQSVGDWPVFPDTPAALHELKKRYKLIVVSNVDRASFARTNLKLGVTFDAVITAEDVGAYKPDHRMFERAFAVLREMGVERTAILHVAQSLYHDHVPAKQLGLTTCWVDRRQGKAGSGATAVPASDAKPDYTVGSLAELVTFLGGG